MSHPLFHVLSVTMTQLNLTLRSATITSLFPTRQPNSDSHTEQRTTSGGAPTQPSNRIARSPNASRNSRLDWGFTVAAFRRRCSGSHLGSYICATLHQRRTVCESNRNEPSWASCGCHVHRLPWPILANLLFPHLIDLASLLSSSGFYHSLSSHGQRHSQFLLLLIAHPHTHTPKNPPTKPPLNQNARFPTHVVRLGVNPRCRCSLWTYVYRK
ncbi:hypothetical protein BDV95DRAFT_82250 [Massariosphaeria phaeospora]|uniref:Uncharacterized protein n=1 Tax=Massariosphaeria phaeospora TaxID=100035 RepID=A0A7C8I6Q7_9PLEO|nr:hypothetical protein BDV95DRAFT_82250 [Massariosphaeria phaeospora]